MAENAENQTENPSTLGDSGRDENGRFATGHKGIISNNPSASKAKELREALLAAVNPVDIQNIIEKLVEKAKTGDVKAAKEVLDRCLGKPKEMVEHNVTGDLAEFLEKLSDGKLQCPSETGD